MALFAHLRRIVKSQSVGYCPTAIAAAGTGSSGVSMASCCLHHIADIAPSTGLLFASAFVTKYRLELIAIGLAGNLVGIVVMALMIRRVKAARKVGV